MPAVPFGSDAVVIVNGDAVIVMLSALVAAFCELSLTWTVKFAGPAAAGVPVIAPAADKLKPAGSDPVETDHA